MKFINDDCFNHISRLSCDVVFTSLAYNRKRNDKYSNYDVILYPFMGLGTTGTACKKFSRDFIGIEKNKEYCDLAMERINNA